jgi:hypothetical protein
LLFCHPATERGCLVTDLDGGWYTHVRTRDQTGREICHYHGTDRGITYEAFTTDEDDNHDVVAGLWDTANHEAVEWPIPTDGYVHTGYDPAGEVFFFESATEDTHEIIYLESFDEGGDHEWGTLVGDWPTFGGGQKAHFHPRMTPDRNWILFVAGDSATETNQIYAVNVENLSPSGVPDPDTR